MFRRNPSGVKRTVRAIESMTSGTGDLTKRHLVRPLAVIMQPKVASLPITVGVGAFLLRDRNLLVVRKTYGPAKGQWTIPSGYVERHESIVNTIEREVKEET